MKAGNDVSTRWQELRRQRTFWLVPQLSGIGVQGRCVVGLCIKLIQTPQAYSRNGTHLRKETVATARLSARYTPRTTYPKPNVRLAQDPGHSPNYLEDIETDGTAVDIEVGVVARRVKLDVWCDVWVVGREVD